MPFGQPFYNYGINPYGGQNNGYVAQQPQYGNFYGQPQNVPHNANNGVTQQYQQQPQTVMPPKTNMPLVTSLMDALNRTVEPNTTIYYADQDQPLIYLVSMDMQGRKTSRTFKVEDVTEQAATKASQTTTDIDLSGYAKIEDLQKLKDEIIGMASAFVAQQSVQAGQPAPQPTYAPIKSKGADKCKVDDKSNKE